MTTTGARIEVSPDGFAMVMATGVVSVATGAHGYRLISAVLGTVAAAVFGVLALGLMHRAGGPAAGLAGLRRLSQNADLAVRAFAFVAACAVLALRWGGSHPTLRWVLDGLGLSGWLVLAPLALVGIGREGELRDRLRGGWLLPSVATSGLAIAVADAAVSLRAAGLVLTALGLWLLAMTIYLLTAAVVVRPALAVVRPDSWILVGGLAIATLAGDHLLGAADTLDLGGPGWSAPLQAATLVLWLGATLWLPVLLAGQARRGRCHGSWWPGVFPIGMYSAACAAGGDALEWPVANTVSLAFCWLALLAWTSAAARTVGSLLHRDTRGVVANPDQG